MHRLVKILTSIICKDDEETASNNAWNGFILNDNSSCDDRFE